MSTTETGNPSVEAQFAASLEAESAARQATWTKVDAPKGAPADPTPIEGKSPATEPTPGSEAPPVTTATPEKDAATEKTPDLSWLPETHREKFSTLDPESLEWMKGNVLRQSDYTKKTQKAAALVKDAESVKEKAALWDQLAKNPELADFTYRALRGEATLPGKASSEDDGVDLTSASNEDIKAYIKREAAAQAKEIAKATIQQEITAPVTRQNATIQALIDFAGEKDIPEEAMGLAIRAAEAHAARLGVEWSAENAVALVEPFLPAANAAPKVEPSKQPATPAGGGLAKVASPASRPAASSPAPMPRHRRENRGPMTDAERVQEALYAVKVRHGIDMTPQELDALFR